jgi:hypothetical protein
LALTALATANGDLNSMKAKANFSSANEIQGQQIAHLNGMPSLTLKFGRIFTKADLLDLAVVFK